MADLDIAGALEAVTQLITSARNPSYMSPVDGFDAWLHYLVAYGAARTGHLEHARRLATVARERIRHDEPGVAYLVGAFEARLEHARAGIRAEAPLPEELARRFARLNGSDVADRVREVSRVLAPYQAVDPSLAVRICPPWLPVPQTTDERMRGIEAALSRRVADRVDQLHGILDELMLLSPEQIEGLLEPVLAAITRIDATLRAALCAKLVPVAEYARSGTVAAAGFDDLRGLLPTLGDPHLLLRWVLPVAARCQLRREVAELAMALHARVPALEPRSAGRDERSLRLALAGCSALLGDLEPVRRELERELADRRTDGFLSHSIDDAVVAATMLPTAEALNAMLAMASVFPTVHDGAAIGLVDAVIRGIIACARRDHGVVRLDEVRPVVTSSVIRVPESVPDVTAQLPDAATLLRDDCDPATEPVAAVLTALDGGITNPERRRDRLEAEVDLTRAYAGFLLAIGHARLGQRLAALALAVRSRDYLSAFAEDETHAHLTLMFTARVATALIGGDVGAPLPEAFAHRLAKVSRTARYKIDRLRETSELLDTRAVDAIRSHIRHQKGTYAYELTALVELVDPEEREEAFTALLDEIERDPGGHEGYLDGVLDALVQFVDDRDRVLPRAARAIASQPEPRRAGLYAKVLGLVSTDTDPLVAELTPALVLAIARAPRPELQVVLRDGLVAFDRLGLMDPLARVLAAAERVLVPDQDGATAPARLGLAAGLFAIGDGVRAPGLLDEAHAILAEPLRMLDRLWLMRCLAHAYARGPRALAMERFAPLAQRLDRITDPLATNTHYCLSVLSFVESIVIGVVGIHF